MRALKRARSLLVRILFIALLIVPSLTIAATGIRMEMPYSLGRERTGVQPGEVFQAVLSLENEGQPARRIPVEIQLPAGVWTAGQNERWQVAPHAAGQSLTGVVVLDGVYGEWFDLITLQAGDELAAGRYPALIRAGETEKIVYLNVTAKTAAGGRKLPALTNIVLPLDRDGKQDGKQGADALVLRDRSLDYYKNLLRGKGASNQEIEAIHPVAYMGLDFDNPSGQQKLLLVTAELSDRQTGQPVPGLFTPGSSGENDGAGAMAGNQERLTAMAALTGAAQQRLLIPLYTDERLLNEGAYVLRVHAEDGESRVWSREMPLRIVKKNIQALITLCLGVMGLAVYLSLAARRAAGTMAMLRTRRLITIALFGTCAFAVVSVPATLLNDFCHILLGPFGFLITGMFSGVVLYMLVAALLTLMPAQGVVSLMAAIRYLLGMLAFGHMSPVMFLATGLNAFLLEAVLAATGITSRRLESSSRGVFSPRQIALLALACALADTTATYVSLQGMSVLYRLYYADWYIYTVMAVNGFCYTAIGAVCGAFLGKRLADVESD